MLRRDGAGADCGPASAAILQRLIGVGRPITDLKVWSRDSGMTSVPELQELLARQGVGTRIVAEDRLNSLGRRTPFIAHLAEGHFVVVTRVGERSVSVIDPSYSRTEAFAMPLRAFEPRWSGYAVASLDPATRPEKPSRRVDRP